MKIALVHDFLIEYGGGERVLEVLHEIYPEAPVYTAFYDLKKLGSHAERFKNWDIRPSWVQKNWFVKKLHSPLRFLTNRVWKEFDFSEYDVVLISSAWYIPRAVALNKKPGSKTRYICYLHTVPRYLYGYATRLNWQKYWPIRIYGNIINFFLRQLDFKASQAIDYFLANSKETQRRITKFYRRESEVIYPPVETVKLNHESRIMNYGKDYYLCVSRLVGPKQIDLAIKACNELKLNLVIVGTGPEEKYLKSIAGPTIKFLGQVPDGELGGIYANCKALIFPALEEDFGIVPVEAMSYGKPVIALRSGGVRETVIDGKTGLFFDESNVESLINIIKKFEKNSNQFKAENCRKQAQQFSKEAFVKKIKDFVEEKVIKSG